MQLSDESSVVFVRVVLWEDFVTILLRRSCQCAIALTPFIRKAPQQADIPDMSVSGVQAMVVGSSGYYKIAMYVL
jgi:hypothetical protein